MDEIDALIDISEGRQPTYPPDKTPEDMFIQDFTSGTAPKVANLIHFIRYQVRIIDAFNDANMYMHRPVLDNTRRATWPEQIDILIKSWLMMFHPVPFKGYSGMPQCDLDIVAKKLMELASFRKGIEKDHLGEYRRLT